jgi:hypothetical protein
VTRAVLEASQIVNKDPRRAVEVSTHFARKSASAEDLTELRKSYPYGEQPIGVEFQRQMLLHARELKRAGVLNPGTTPGRYVNRVTASLLG